ncbi:MAG TPA: TRAP transporter small permease [Paracoccaceae bacterium]|nr:TRAP transporter small permease [Paracoccaceae bacterium]
MTLLSRLSWATDRLIDLCVILGAAGLLVALGVTATDVVGRAFGHPLYGARDIVSMAGVFVVFGGMAQAHRKGAHVAVDLLERRFPPGLNRFLTIQAHALGAVIFALIAWQLWLAVDLARMLRMSTNLLYLPRAPFLMAMTGLALVCAFSMALRAIEAALRTGTEGRP